MENIKYGWTFLASDTLVFVSAAAGLTRWMAVFTSSIIWRLNQEQHRKRGG